MTALGSRTSERVMDSTNTKMGTHMKELGLMTYTMDKEPTIIQTAESTAVLSPPAKSVDKES